MTAEREGLTEEIAEVLLRHQRIPQYGSNPGLNRCTGCDNLLGETDGSNSPRHVAHLADALADLLAARDRRVRAEAWTEGFDRGFYDPLAGHGASGRDASESAARNPYEADE